MNINYERFVRVLERCAELGQQAGINPAIAHVYNVALAGPAAAYLDADSAVSDALVACEKESAEAFQALSFLETPYKVARSTLKAIHPETVKARPATLASLTTDTDKLKAIRWLHDEIQKHAGAAWADAQLTGEFGLKAEAALKEIGEAIDANKDLTTAKMARAAAYEPAYVKYVDFKQVVRDALGAGSKEYRRIHLRASPKRGKKGDEDCAPASEEAPESEETPEVEAEAEAEAEAAPESEETPIVQPPLTSTPISPPAPSTK
jgi:hypothetical protein